MGFETPHLKGKATSKEKESKADIHSSTEITPSNFSLDEITSLENETKDMDFSLSVGETNIKKIFPRERESRLKELIFGYLICKDLEKEVVRELEDQGVSDEVITNLRAEINKLSIEDRKRVLAWPRELRISEDRNGFFSQQVTRLLETEDAAEFIEALQSVASDPSRRWTIGYHISNVDISPAVDGSWMIRGTENDHRDDDLSRAYYSLSYEMLYREKMQLGSYIYLIRGSENDSNDGKWYRTGTLSVIHRVGVHEFDRKTKEFYDALIERVYNTDQKAA